MLIETIKKNKIAVIPHDTVPGIIARLSVENAKKILEIKNRPKDKGFIVLIPNTNHLNMICNELNAITKHIIQHFWPGPLTIIVEKKDCIPPIITGYQSTVAIRYPKYSELNHLLNELKEPVISTSANISSKSSISQSILNQVDYVHPSITVNTQLNEDVASTILDCTTETPQIKRAGCIHLSKINECISRYKSLPKTPDK